MIAAPITIIRHAGRAAVFALISAPAFAGDAVTVTYAYWDTSVTPAFQAAADQFHIENPGITIELRTVPFDGYFTKLNTEIASQTAPDAFWLQNIQFPLYASNGVLADMAPFQATSGIDLSGIPANLMAPYMVDGKMLAVPFQVLPFGLYYNKTLFDAAGIAEPTNDWTWDDVAVAAKALTDKEKGVYGIVAPLWNYGTFYQTMYEYGAQVISADGKSTDFDGPEAVAGLSVWVDFHKNGYSPSISQLADTSAGDYFSSGKAAMISSGSWEPQGMVKALGDAVRVVEMPAGPADNSAYATTTTAVSISSPNVEAAAKWAAFLGGEEGQLIMNSNSGGGTGAPVNAKAADAWIATAPTVGLENLISGLSKARLLPATMNTLAWEQELTPTLAPAYDGTQTVQEAATAMAVIIRDKLSIE